MSDKKNILVNMFGLFFSHEEPIPLVLSCLSPYLIFLEGFVEEASLKLLQKTTILKKRAKNLFFTSFQVSDLNIQHWKFVKMNI